MSTLRLTARWLAMLTLIALSISGIAARGAPPSPAAAPPAAAPAASDGTGLDENIDLIERLGGRIDATYKNGDRLYLLTGSDLIVVDVANPAAPSVLGRTTLPAPPEEVAFAGDYLYFNPYSAAWEDEQPLYIMNMHDPLHPQLVSTYVGGTYLQSGPQILDLVTDGHYVYRLIVERDPNTAYDYWMDIIDVSDPAHPSMVNYVHFTEALYFLRTMTLANGRLYIGYDHGRNGALIVDVSNPGADLSGKIWNVVAEPSSGSSQLQTLQVEGNRLTIVFNNEADLWGDVIFNIFDVSDPAQPIRLGSFAGGDGGPLTKILFGVAGTKGLFVDEGPQYGLRVADLANPAAPVLLGSLMFGPAAHVQSLWQDGLAYMLSQEITGETILRIIDIQNPAAPLERGRLIVSPFQISGNVVEQDGVLYTLAISSYALSTQGYLGALIGYDVSDPAHPVELSRLALQFNPDSLFMEDGYLYIGGRNAGYNVIAIDVRNPSTPVIAGTYTAPPQTISLNLLGVKDRLAYVRNNNSDLKVIDFSNLAAPQVVATIDARPDSLDFSGDMVWFIEDYSYYPYMERLTGVDMTNPAAPHEVGALDIDAPEPHADRLVIGGRYAYIWATDNLLRVIDIANPAAPTQVLAYQMANTPSSWWVYDSAHSLVLDDGYLYAITRSVLRVVDVSRPLQPSVVASASGLVDGWSLDVSGQVIFLQQLSGLSILRNRAGSVAGVVRQANQLPFAGAGLDISTGVTTTSDLVGGYRFQDLPRTTVSVTPTLAGYAFWPPYRSASLPPNLSADFVITAAPATVALSPAGPARLVITDTQGLPTAFDFAASLAPSATVTPTPLLHQAPFGLTFAGHAFALSDGTPEVAVTVGLSAADLRLASAPGQLALWRWAGQTWVAGGCGAASYDPATRRLSARLCQAGEYAVLAPTHQLALPQVRVR